MAHYESFGDLVIRPNAEYNMGPTINVGRVNKKLDISIRGYNGAQSFVNLEDTIALRNKLNEIIEEIEKC